MTIDQTVSWIAWSLLLTSVVLLVFAVRRIVGAGRLRYYLLRREQTAGGWRLALVAVVVGLAAVVVFTLGRPAAYVVFPPTPSITPSPTASLTPTITDTPTITVTPSISATPSVTPTATASPTPQLPDLLLLALQETVTPRPEAILSPILFATRLNVTNLAIAPSESFENPIETLYGAFTYDGLDDGVRWTALWYLEGRVVCSEGEDWTGGTGGYGYTECTPERGWLPGEYEVQIFLGTTWKISGRFAITGDPPTPTPSRTP